MTRRTLILTIIVFIIAFFVRCYWFSQKQGFHTDEIFTVVVSKNNEYGFIKHFDTEKTYTGKELKDLVFGFNDNSSKEIFNDLKDLRVHNNWDTPNTPLYYSLFRIFQFGNNSSDIKTIFQRGFYLNLILFTLSFFFMFKLLNILNFDKKYIPFILAFCYLNTGTISISIFARYYALQEMAFVIMAYVFASIYKSEKINTVKNFLKVVLSGALTLLSGYYGIIYSSILGLILIIKKRPVWFLIISMLVSIGLTFLIYPNYLDFISAPRVSLLDKSLLSNITKHSFLSFITCCQILLNYLFYSFVTLILLLTLILNKKFIKDSILWILIGVNIICFVLFLLLAPQKIMRYTEPLFPILALIIPAIVFEAKKAKNILISILSLIFILSFSIPSKFESYDSMLNIPQISVLTGNIENLFVNTTCEPIKFSDYSILISENKGWNILNVIPYFKDEQSVKIDYSDEPEIFKGKSLILFTEKSLILPSDIKIKQDFSCQRFKGYVIDY